jgi:hypothetical protein
MVGIIRSFGAGLWWSTLSNRRITAGIADASAAGRRHNWRPYNVEILLPVEVVVQIEILRLHATFQARCRTKTAAVRMSSLLFLFLQARKLFTRFTPCIKKNTLTAFPVELEIVDKGRILDAGIVHVQLRLL